MTGRDAVLQAFDRLFERAAARLRVECGAEERAEAREHFIERFGAGLALADQVTMPTIPEEVLQTMEDAVEQVSPAQLAGYLAAIPLIQETRDVLQRISYQAAQQRLLEYAIGQADDRYGGN